MKVGIHPDYVDTTITCACGEVVHTRSTRPDIRVEVCSKCHPFYTGKHKLMDTAGRVERFQKKYKRQPLATGRRACIGGTADVQAQASKRQQTQLIHRDDFPMTLG